MNREELLARDYLVSIGRSSIVFEPDGNVTPDFLVDNTVAVEVTRLNEHIEIDGVLKRLDDDSASITSFISDTLQNFSSDLKNVSFWVNINIKRPFGNRKRAKQSLIKLLRSFEGNEDVLAQRNYHISEGLSVSFTVATHAPQKPVFRLGGISQHDQGGFVPEEMSKNFRNCVERKASSVKPHKLKYKEWWLILVDSVCYGGYSEYIDEFKATFDKSCFDKVVVLEAIEGKYVFEI